MKELTVVSKTHGSFVTILDDEDYELIKNTPGFIAVGIKRGNPYIRKWVSTNKIVELHRLVMGEPKGLYVDHKNGNTLDNRKENLRAVSNAANIRNGKIRSNNVSGYTGIRKYILKKTNKPVWYVRIRVNYKVIHIGTYHTFEDAVKARKTAEKKYYDI